MDKAPKKTIDNMPEKTGKSLEEWKKMKHTKCQNKTGYNKK